MPGRRDREAGAATAFGAYKTCHLVEAATVLKIRSGGNTLVTEGSCGRIIEVTPDYQIVWEYVSPYFSKRMMANVVYRTYRVPYEWVPQAHRPEEKAVPRQDNSRFRVPGPKIPGRHRITRLANLT